MTLFFKKERIATELHKINTLMRKYFTAQPLMQTSFKWTRAFPWSLTRNERTGYRKNMNIVFSWINFKELTSIKKKKQFQTKRNDTSFLKSNFSLSFSCRKCDVNVSLNVNFRKIRVSYFLIIRHFF